MSIAMKRFQRKHPARQICRRIAATLLLFAVVVPPFAARAECDLDAYMRGKMFGIWVNDDADKFDSEENPRCQASKRTSFLTCFCRD